MTNYYTFHPDLGAPTTEPSVYEIVFKHYAQYYTVEVAITHTVDYVKQIQKDNL